MLFGMGLQPHCTSLDYIDMSALDLIIMISIYIEKMTATFQERLDVTGYLETLVTQEASLCRMLWQAVPPIVLDNGYGKKTIR